MDEKLNRIITAMLCEDGRTPEEAASVRAKAIDMLAKRGYTEDDLTDMSKPELVEERIQANRMTWHVATRICVSIAQVTGTRVVISDIMSKSYNKTDRKWVNFLGYKPDTEWALWLMDHLMNEAKRQRVAAGIPSGKPAEDFMAAFGSAVYKRLNNLLEATMERRADNMPVPAEVNAFYKEKYPFTSLSRSGGRKMSNAEAAAAGREAGRQASLGRPVGGSSTGPRLLT